MSSASRTVEDESAMWMCLCLGSVLLLMSGCASYGVVVNVPQEDGRGAGESYSIASYVKRHAKRDNDIELTLAFSGGGTRAAAFSYGVLEALRDTRVEIDGYSEGLLDEVDVISSVSGGSFTAAYYGLHGDRIFEDFEEVFLRRDIKGGLVRGLFNPLRWFNPTGRTEMAIEHYEDKVFKGATFADMMDKDRPLIAINTTDLPHGVRFTFVQEYFDLLCSDLTTFPVARAVAASSAVPILFNPVVLKNYSGCMAGKPDWFVAAKESSVDNSEMALVVDSLETYFDKNKSRYGHFVDGGITDNLGLRAFYEVVEIAGGAESFLAKIDQKRPRRMVLIVVNASTDQEYGMSTTNKGPSLKEIISAMTGIQLHRYNAATLDLMEGVLARWAAELSTPERPVVPYFIKLGFQQIKKPEERLFFDRIPTSFSLSDEQVDKLIEAGRELLLANPEFRRLLKDLRTDSRG